MSWWPLACQMEMGLHGHEHSTMYLHQLPNAILRLSGENARIDAGKWLDMLPADPRWWHCERDDRPFRHLSSAFLCASSNFVEYRHDAVHAQTKYENYLNHPGCVTGVQNILSDGNARSQPYRQMIEVNPYQMMHQLRAHGQSKIYSTW